MRAQNDLRQYVIVSCSTVRPELEHLKKEGFFNPVKILYTAPGLHENPHELKAQLKRQLDRAKKYSENIIVVYGSRCYIDIKDPSQDIDRLIQQQNCNTTRIKAKNCIDMLCSLEEREKISKGQKIYWLSWGWLQYWKQIFKDWDIGKANETFPQHDKAMVLDVLGLYEKYSADYPEKILEFADWMKLGIESYKISLDRFRGLLSDEISRIKEVQGGSQSK